MTNLIRPKLAPVLQELINRLEIKFVEPSELTRLGYEPLRRTSGGFWCALQDFICVVDDVPGKFVNNQDRFLMHEIIHWSGQVSRLCRPAIKRVIDHHNGLDVVIPSLSERDTEEATAEIGMLKLGSALGLNMHGAKAQVNMYLSHYPYADLKQAEADAEKAVEYILEKAYGYRTQKELTAA